MSKITGLFFLLVLAVLRAVPASAQDSEIEIKSSDVGVDDVRNLRAKGLDIAIPDFAQDPSKRTIEFQFFLVKASNAGETDVRNDGLLKDKVPPKMLTALNEVASLTRYKSFELIDDPLLPRTLRIQEESEKGKANIFMSRSFTEGGNFTEGRNSLSVGEVEISENAGKRRIRVGRFTASINVQQYLGSDSYGDIYIDTPLEFRDGEMKDNSLKFTEGDMVVIGTSRTQSGVIPDATIIVIVTAKIL